VVKLLTLNSVLKINIFKNKGKQEKRKKTQDQGAKFKISKRKRTPILLKNVCTSDVVLG